MVSPSRRIIAVHACNVNIGTPFPPTDLVGDAFVVHGGSGNRLAREVSLPVRARVAGFHNEVGSQPQQMRSTRKSWRAGTNDRRVRCRHPGDCWVLGPHYRHMEYLEFTASRHRAEP